MDGGDGRARGHGFRLVDRLIEVRHILNLDPSLGCDNDDRGRFREPEFEAKIVIRSHFIREFTRGVNAARFCGRRRR